LYILEIKKVSSLNVQQKFKSFTVIYKWGERGGGVNKPGGGDKI